MRTKAGEVEPMDAEQYRRKAEQYFTFAHQMSDPNAKAAVIDVAAHWMEMANQAEQSKRVDQQQRKRSQVA